MGTRWSLTIDCAHPARLAAFWASALGYVVPAAPKGYATWQQWFADHDVPEEEWDDAAYLADPDATGPRLSFLKVPESKITKNRVHIDVQAGGGRETPWEVRWPRVLEAVRRLTAAGATVLHEDVVAGRPDHVVLADPEGNEFCVL